MRSGVSPTISISYCFMSLLQLMMMRNRALAAPSYAVPCLAAQSLASLVLPPGNAPQTRCPL
jgi:hypothetical protein